MIDRRTFIAAAGAGLAAPFVLRSRARAAEVTLRLRHFLSARSHVQRDFLQPWASEVQAASGGRMEIQIFAPVQRAATPPPLYDGVRAGTIDIGWTTIEQNPGRFPRLEVFELPFVGAREALVNSQAIQEFSDKHMTEIFADVRPLVVWGEGHNVIHAKKQIASLDELRGVRTCPPTRLGGKALEALGAVAVTVAAAHVPEALAQNVLDGCLAPWQDAPPLNLDEATSFHTEIPGSPTLSTGVSMLVMNRARFDGLPEEFRRILLEKSGGYGAAMAGRALDGPNTEIIAAVQARGHMIVPLAEDEKARWVATTQPVIESWIAEMQGKGADGNALLAEARALITKYQPPAEAGLRGPTQPLGAGPLRDPPVPGPPAETLAPPPPPPPAGTLPVAPLPAGPLVSPPAPLISPPAPPVPPPAP